MTHTDEAPWGDLKGNAISARGIAKLLKPYGVASKNLRDGNVTKGYARADLLDPWARYLGPLPLDCATCATAPTEVADVADVAFASGEGPSAIVDDAETL